MEGLLATINWKGSSTSPQFQNMNDHVNYLDPVESRVKGLKGQVEALKMKNETLDNYIKNLSDDASKMLPKTGLISSGFIERAFTVWSHYFVAQLIISVPIVYIYLIIVIVMVQQGISNIPAP